MVFGREGDVLIIMMMVLISNECVELNESMFSSFIGFKKAYDSVDRDEF